MCRLWGYAMSPGPAKQAIENYVARAAPYMSAELLAHLQASFAVVRRRGYAISANGPSAGQSRQATVLPIGQTRDEAYWSSVFNLAGQLTLKEMQLFDIAEAGPEGV